MTDGEITVKRDATLILKILSYVRDNATDRQPLPVPNCKDYDPDVVRYHVRLCIEAGFLREFEPRVMSGEIRIQSLTWQGHEHLEANFDC